MCSRAADSRRKIDPRWLPVGVIAAVLAGCSGGASPTPVGPADRTPSPERPPRIEQTSSSPQLLIRPVVPAGGDALYAGQLQYLVQADCFVLGPGPGAGTTNSVVVWPEGTTASSTGSGTRVVVPHFGDVLVGEWVMGPGEFAQPDENFPNVPPECQPSGQEYLIVHGVDRTSTQPLP